MFNDMRDEVRNLLLVAYELGGEAAQYVKVLRVEKERLLPVDAIQAEMKELKAQAEQASAAESTRDSYNEQLTGWYKWLKEASKEARVSGVARNFYDRDSLMEAIRSPRKDPSAVSLELKKAEDKLSRVAAALDAPVRSSTYIDYPGVDIIVAAVRAPVREAMKDE